jgi:hypothetical protein
MYKTKTLSFDAHVRLFWMLTFICVASLALYVYGINATVRNTVARQNIEAEIANISTQLGEMEFAYIGLKNKISLSVAYERGFQSVESPTFISRTPSRSLSLNVTSR